MSARFICFAMLAVTLPACSHLYRAEDGTEWRTMDRIPSGRLPVASLAYSSDGSRLVSTHTSLWQHGMRVSMMFPPDGVMRIWRCRENGLSFHELLAARSIPRLRIEPVQFEYGASVVRLVVTGKDRNKIVTCDAENLEWSIRSSDVDVSAVSADGRYLVHLRSWDESTDRNVVRFTDTNSGRVHDISVDGVLSWPWQFVSSEFFCIEHRTDSDLHWLHGWDAETGAAIDPIPLKTRPFYMAVSSSGLQAVTAGLESSTFEIISRGHSNAAQEFTVKAGTIHGLAVSARDNLVAVCGETDLGKSPAGFIELWDIATGTRVSRMIEDSSWGVTAVCFSPDGKQLAAGTGAGEIVFLSTDGPGSAFSHSHRSIRIRLDQSW